MSRSTFVSRGYVATLVAMALLPIISRDPVLWLPVVLVGLPASLGAILAIYPPVRTLHMGPERRGSEGSIRRWMAGKLSRLVWAS